MPVRMPQRTRVPQHQWNGSGRGLHSGNAAVWCQSCVLKVGQTLLLWMLRLGPLFCGYNRLLPGYIGFLSVLLFVW